MREATTTALLIVIVPALMLLGAPCAMAQPFEPVDIDSGIHQNLTDEPVVAFATIVSSPGATWLWVHFDSYSNLIAGSYIAISSLADGGQQFHDMHSLSAWRGGSAYFAGDSVLVQLVVAPGAGGVWCDIDLLRAGTPGALLDEVCPDDDFAPADTAGVGRLFPTPGTVWLASNGAAVVGARSVFVDCLADPPTFPPSFLYSVVEFDVRTALPDGTLRPADPADQYPIDWNRVSADCEGGTIEIPDFIVFGLGPGGDGSHPASHGFLRPSSKILTPGVDLVRVTGYVRSDEQVDHLDQQAATGIVLDWDPDSIDHSAHGGSTSTVEPWLEGAPIVELSTGHVVGAQLVLGCDINSWATPIVPGQVFWQRLQYFHGLAMHVDALSPASTQYGGFATPFETVSEGVAAAMNFGNHQLVIVAGDYPETVTIDYPMRLIAPVGTVRIGD